MTSALRPLRLIAAAALIAAGSASTATAATWNKTSAGTYSWSDPANWTDGTLPTAMTDAVFNNPTAAQTVTAGNASAACLDIKNYTSASAFERTFEGSLTVVSNVFRTGATHLTGTLSVVGENQSFSRIGSSQDQKQRGTLYIENGGTFSAPGSHALIIPRSNSPKDSKAFGLLVLRDGGTLVLATNVTSSSSCEGFQFGRDATSAANFASGAYLQEGGCAHVGRMMLGFSKGARSAITVTGGSLNFPYVENTRYRIGHLGYGLFQVLGGEVKVYVDGNAPATQLSGTINQNSFEIGGSQTAADGSLGASLYVGGNGVFRCLRDLCIAGGANAANANSIAPADLTITDNGVVTSRTIRVGAAVGKGRASLNLNGGGLATSGGIARGTEREGASTIVADGGSIQFYGDADLTQFSGIDSITIREGGLTIRCDTAVRIGSDSKMVPLRTPEGLGLASLDLRNEGDNRTMYAIPPLIEITGGSGSNATAMAFIDYDTGVLTNIVVTCHGEGYEAGDSLTVLFLKNGASAADFTSRSTYAFGENRPGKLVKEGGQNLSLFAQPEFKGTYEVRQGYMIQTTTAGVAAPNVAAVVAGGGSGNGIATFQAGSGNATAVEANWNPINPAATLTLGTEHGPGRLAVPGAAAGETKPFEQAFASLAVNGTGNSIIFGGGNSQAIGVRLSFGTISCAAGSQLTIPNPKSTFKVYCTGMPAGTPLKNIVFENDAIHTATVGDDGQIVPQPLAFVLVVR